MTSLLKIRTRTITFTANDISRPLVLLLAFDFAKSNVEPSSLKQEQYPVVWRVIKIEANKSETVTYTSRFVFTKAEVKEQPEEDKELWVLNPPTVIGEIEASKQTMLVEDNGKYSFTPPIQSVPHILKAINGTPPPPLPATINLAFGFYEVADPAPGAKPVQNLYFHAVSQGKPVALDFSPILRAYFVPDGYYVERQVLTMPIPSPSVLEVNIDTLPSDQTSYTITIDDDNRAIIVDPNYTS